MNKVLVKGTDAEYNDVVLESMIMFLAAAIFLHQSFKTLKWCTQLHVFPYIGGLLSFVVQEKWKLLVRTIVYILTI